MNKVVITLIMMCVLCAAEMVAQGSRIMLTQLERGQVQPADDSLRSGQIGLTNGNGDQRYAPYVEIQVDTVNFIPSDTGNLTNLSEFVFDSTGALWYIDWQGRAVEFAGSSSSCDVDWLQISDNSCPAAITDSIYHQKYASVGARYVWPGAEFLVNDSTASGIAVIQGSRNARLALYDSGAPGTFLMIDHGGTTPVVYMPVNANLIFKTTAGTPQTPVGSQVDHFGINTQDSTIQMFQYDNTRTDTQSVVNFLYTDLVGKIRSRPVAYISDTLVSSVNFYNTSDQFTGARYAQYPAGADSIKLMIGTFAAYPSITYNNGTDNGLVLDDYLGPVKANILMQQNPAGANGGRSIGLISNYSNSANLSTTNYFPGNSSRHSTFISSKQKEVEINAGSTLGGGTVYNSRFYAIAGDSIDQRNAVVGVLNQPGENIRSFGVAKGHSSYGRAFAADTTYKFFVSPNNFNTEDAVYMPLRVDLPTDTTINTVFIFRSPIF